MRFSVDLLAWYTDHKRDLPWRKTKDPYLIWLSEIILQQTRVNQGLSYYQKFVEHYPSVNDLALASQDEVLNLWQGLGYYSRARNLHFTAKYISKEFDGKFPSTYKEILQLKGVGEYTAAAIASFAYNLPHAVVDGNVYRVLARIYGVELAIDSTQGKKAFKELANNLLDKDNPGNYNQAIMEFGALQCTPKKPTCENCPFRLECVAFKKGQIDLLPRKEKKLKQQERYFNYLIVEQDDCIYLKQRNDSDIWQGLYDFPLLESKTSLNLLTEHPEFSSMQEDFVIQKVSNPIKHVLSHQKIFARFWHLLPTNTEFFDNTYQRIPVKEINNYPVPKLIENYIQTIF